jgi:toxin-antitoxin system PIN domain toxin
MILVDVNVLVYAHRADSPGHNSYRQWLEDVINSDRAYGVSDLVLSGFLRIVTHPKVFDPPSDLAAALAFANEVRDQPNAVRIMPGPRHWDVFTRLCQAAGVKGNLIPGAYFAALAIESGSEWITTDRDYSRFPGLRSSHPLQKLSGTAARPRTAPRRSPAVRPA